MAENHSKPTNVIWLPMQDVLKIAQKYVEVKYGIKNAKAMIYDSWDTKKDASSGGSLTVAFTAPLPFNDAEVQQVSDEIKDRKLEPEL